MESNLSDQRFMVLECSENGYFFGCPPTTFSFLFPVMGSATLLVLFGVSYIFIISPEGDCF